MGSGYKWNDGGSVTENIWEQLDEESEPLDALNEGRDVIMDGTLSWVPFVVQTITMARNVHRKRYRMGSGYKWNDDRSVTENIWEQLDEESEPLDGQYRLELCGVVCDPDLAIIIGISFPGQSKKENLEALVVAANDNDNSHILHVPEDQLSIRELLSRSPILSGTGWEQCSSSESIIASQKAQIEALTHRNEKLKRKLEYFRTESLKFARKVQDHGARNW
nr:zeta toxin domain, P-loop containing nucleoside triphosphate hydrolase [Tanacetum cinerariifolium]